MISCIRNPNIHWFIFEDFIKYLPYWFTIGIIQMTYFIILSYYLLSTNFIKSIVQTIHRSQIGNITVNQQVIKSFIS